MQYTSGTTSRPKGVLWTHGNALWGARTSAIHENLNETDIHLVMMPSFHTNARTYSILPTMWTGGTVVLMPKFSASRFWDIALRNRCTWASMLPFFLKALAQHPIPQHHFRMFGMAANETPFDEVFGVRSIGWWGMTGDGEPGHHRRCAAAQPLDDNGPTGARLRHPHSAIPTARRLRPGETGHLECWGWRGIQLFLEYLNNPQATAESFTPDGWFMTGDRVTLEKRRLHHLFRPRQGHAEGRRRERRGVRDRARDRAGAGRLRVRHRRAEASHARRGAGGVRHRGAFCRRRRVRHCPSEIITECKAKLADFKVPRAVFVVDEMPRSTLEKIHKAELRKRLPVAG